MPTILFSLVLFLAPLLSALPEEPVWSLVFAAAVLAAAVLHTVLTPPDERLWRPILAIFAVAALAILSLLAHWLIGHHGAPVYLDTMLRGAVFWLAGAAAFWLAASARRREQIYLVVIAITGGAAVAAGIGFQDYLLHVRHHESQWREFGTSTPDFFAGHLVMTFPVALALFLASKSGKGNIFWLPYAVALLLELAVVPTTGSRFALVSIVIGLAAFAVAAFVGLRAGLALSKDVKVRLAALAVTIVLGALVVAKPTSSRFQPSTFTSQAHSGNFRVWTWKGTARLIAADPLLGAGPGMFVYAYPRRALVGFTRHAHSAYLQTAADIGVPALLLLLEAVGFILFRSFSELTRPDFTGNAISANKRGALAELFDQVALVDDRYLAAGIIGSLAAALAQNLIDSDWYTFASGITFFALAGTLTAQLPPRQPLTFTKGARYMLTAIFATGTIAAAFLAYAEILEQSGGYFAAAQANPLNGAYQSDAAMYYFLPNHDLAGTETYLLASCRLAPDSVNYHRLGSFYLEDNRPLDARHAFEKGLEYDPHSIELLISLAQLTLQLGDPQASLGYYQRVASLETTPYGTVRAIPEVSETRFADADSAVGDSLLNRGRPDLAIPYYDRAMSDCEEYSEAGGAAQPMRAALDHNIVDTSLDTHMRTLYIGVMNNLSLAYIIEGEGGEADALKRHGDAVLKSFPGS